MANVTRYALQIETLLEIEARHRDDRRARERPRFMMTIMP